MVWLLLQIIVFYVESQNHLNYPNLLSHILKFPNGKIRNLASFISIEEVI